MTKGVIKDEAKRSHNDSIALKALLSTFNSTDYKDYYRFLSPQLVEQMQEIELRDTIDFAHLLSKDRWLETIHYSWFLPILEKYPTQIIPLFLGAFPPFEKNELKKWLKIFSEKKLSLPLQVFLRSVMYKKLGVNEVLPRDMLPFSDMNILLSLPKREVTLLIDLLGIYDLAYEMRQIVDKNLINKVRSSLSQDELTFLGYASTQAFRWIPDRLNIASWDGDTKKLKTLLHFRGLTRLSFATHLEDKNFLWHLSHLLDIGRGNALLKLWLGKSDPAMIPYFKGQVLDIVKRFPK